MEFLAKTVAWLIIGFVVMGIIMGLLEIFAPKAHAEWRTYARDPQVTRDFQYQHPCPSTGLRYGSCPGYIKDHINPLCAGGPDAVSNMQWQTTEDSYRKDEWELALCRKLRYQERVSAPAERATYPLHHYIPTWTNNPRTDR